MNFLLVNNKVGLGGERVCLPDVYTLGRSGKFSSEREGKMCNIYGSRKDI